MCHSQAPLCLCPAFSKLSGDVRLLGRLSYLADAWGPAAGAWPPFQHVECSTATGEITVHSLICQCLYLLPCAHLYTEGVHDYMQPRVAAATLTPSCLTSFLVSQERARPLRVAKAQASAPSLSQHGSCNCQAR